MSGMETAVSIALGIGLAAAVGFRVFLPLLVASIAAYTGHLHLDANFAWLGSLTAADHARLSPRIVEVLAILRAGRRPTCSTPSPRRWRWSRVPWSPRR